MIINLLQAKSLIPRPCQHVLIKKLLVFTIYRIKKIYTWETLSKILCVQAFSWCSLRDQNLFSSTHNSPLSVFVKAKKVRGYLTWVSRTKLPILSRGLCHTGIRCIPLLKPAVLAIFPLFWWVSLCHSFHSKFQTLVWFGRLRWHVKIMYIFSLLWVWIICLFWLAFLKHCFKDYGGYGCETVKTTVSFVSKFMFLL